MTCPGCTVSAWYLCVPVCLSDIAQRVDFSRHAPVLGLLLFFFPARRFILFMDRHTIDVMGCVFEPRWVCRTPMSWGRRFVNVGWLWVRRTGSLGGRAEMLCPALPSSAAEVDQNRRFAGCFCRYRARRILKKQRHVCRNDCRRWYLPQF